MPELEMPTKEAEPRPAQKKEIGLETFVFIALFIGFFAVFAMKMGLVNTMNTLMNTAYSLLMDTVFYLMAICVVMGAVSDMLSEFGVVSLANRLLQPLMKPLYGLPGAASLGIVTTFLSDNPVILTLADNRYFRSFFKAYQFPALTNLVYPKSNCSGLNLRRRFLSGNIKNLCIILYQITAHFQKKS